MKLSRILFVHSGSDLYGASRSLLRLSSRLTRDGVSVSVILPHEGPLVFALRQNGVEVVIQKNLPVIERRKAESLRGLIDLLINLCVSIYSIFRLIKQFNPQIIHTMTAVILSSGPAARLAGIPHIWHVREFFNEFGWLWRYYQRYMVLFSSRIVCVSTPVASQFEELKTNGKLLVLHNGFPAEEFAGVSADRVEMFRSKYAAAGVQFLVGVVGRIKFQRKGQEVFVRAAGLLKTKFPDARFLCIGSPFPGNEKHLASLLDLVKELSLVGYVLYTGDIEDIKAAIKGLDILVLSSTQPEPFGGVVVEAMALSRPVVATKAGGSLEQVVDGVTGYLVEPGNPEEMADHIERLLQSPERRQTFGARGHARFMEKFEFEQFYSSVVRLYGQVMQLRAGS